MPRQRPSICFSPWTICNRLPRCKQSSFVRRATLSGERANSASCRSKLLQDRNQKFRGIVLLARHVAKRDDPRTNLFRRVGRRVVGVDADADNELAIRQDLDENAGQFAAVEHDVVRPVNADLMARQVNGATASTTATPAASETTAERRRRSGHPAASHLRPDQQTECETPRAGPPAVANLARGRQSGGPRGSKGKLHPRQGRTLGRPVVGRADRGVVLHVGNEGFFENFPQVLHSRLDCMAEPWYFLPDCSAVPSFPPKQSPIIASWQNATGTR